MALQHIKHENVFLRDAGFGEAWLEEQIKEDPSIIGLGSVRVLGRQRNQPKAGRLDLLLESLDGEDRYEVELMLGETDPDHIVRCIEYWDIERRRYPRYDHVAVLVAEDITGRFLNILSLFAGSIPLIVLQLNALKIGESIALDFVKVIDQRSLLRDDDSQENSNAPADRSSWLEYAGPQNMSVVDRMIEILNEKASSKQNLNFRQQYIGLTDGTRSRNFVMFSPNTQVTDVWFKVSNVDEWAAKLKQAGLKSWKDSRYVAVRVPPNTFQSHEALFRELAHQAVAEHQG